MATLGWCLAAAWKVTQVLGNTGTEVENKEEFCHCTNQWFSHIMGEVFGSGCLMPEKIWKNKMSFEERPQAQSEEINIFHMSNV